MATYFVFPCSIKEHQNSPSIEIAKQIDNLEIIEITYKTYHTNPKLKEKIKCCDEFDVALNLAKKGNQNIIVFANINAGELKKENILSYAFYKDGQLHEIANMPFGINQKKASNAPIIFDGKFDTDYSSPSP
ncbi:hypothetical protein L3V83_07100 [Thiotrichales bacterium 19X7-9]|nr:hypothetical protein [Thiotrichales bacterium 19X7-9]